MADQEKTTLDVKPIGLTSKGQVVDDVFRWTDNSATGTSGFIWTEGQPSNYACEIRYNGTNRAIKGYVCGKKTKN
ncbi:hypothetical protein CAEBREN_04788 [Caenorhabditis brenneri]|uniref:C-type lectin domain-containing protein n=1 Tax=Caenorhabditis brenneri TaxID=135651 RepID=G0NQL8_CAEBE|nr:hypothetical protein CAEBREN_04788 [Caenorhabditis brenneri]